MDDVSLTLQHGASTRSNSQPEFSSLVFEMRIRTYGEVPELGVPPNHHFFWGDFGLAPFLETPYIGISGTGHYFTWPFESDCQGDVLLPERDTNRAGDELSLMIAISQNITMILSISSHCLVET